MTFADTAEAVAHWTAEAEYWTAEVPRAEAYSAGAGAVARHALDNAKAQLAAAVRVHDAAKVARTYQNLEAYRRAEAGAFTL